jgi:hypothetical protein
VTEPPAVGQTILAAVARLEPGRAASLLPAPLEPAGDRVHAYVVWATLQAEGRTVRGRAFAEANLALPCLGPEGEGTWFLRSWFPSPDLVRHCALVGWGAGVLAEVAPPRVPFAARRWAWRTDAPLGGWVAVEGRRELELRVRLAGSADRAQSPLANLSRVYGVRTLGGRRDVLVERHLTERITDFRAGEAELRVAGPAAATLGTLTVEGGYLVELGMTHGGQVITG